MAEPADDIERHLLQLRSLRGEARGLPPRLKEVKRWQASRLEATYADLASEPRYHEATRFFLDDLYGPKDFSNRDQALMRILPAMKRMLPASAVQTAALAIELEALSEDLDQRLARALGRAALDGASYARAYRESAEPAERERQIALIVAVGDRLDALVRKPLVLRTLKLMRQPARMAGLADLQDFLERGFEAFRAMGGARPFLEMIQEREREIASRLFSGEPLAFAP